ncbi:MAG TPA: hypothetical protein VEX38_08405, partial [Fimbriimonadaceae bacterium]|nr:hypothetical protein [Fimbriimonadaceae bacterium]
DEDGERLTVYEEDVAAFLTELMKAVSAMGGVRFELGPKPPARGRSVVGQSTDRYAHIPRPTSQSVPTLDC